jgi:membrane protein insertase Oxa1/YidC/SpoIIIJ
MYLTHELHLGMGMATIIFGCATRLIFFLLNIKNTKKLKMLKKIEPDLIEYKKHFHIAKKARDFRIMGIESKKMQEFTKKFVPSESRVKIFILSAQGLVFLTFASLVQRFSFKVEDYPEILSGGFLWFKDLSMPDPYFILPVINQFILLLMLYVNFKLNHFIILSRQMTCQVP